MGLLRGRGQPRSLQLNPPSPKHPTVPGLRVSPCLLSSDRKPGCLGCAAHPHSSLQCPLCFLALCLNATCPSSPSSVLPPPGSLLGLTALRFPWVSENWAIRTAQLILLSSLPTRGAYLASLVMRFPLALVSAQDTGVWWSSQVLLEDPQQGGSESARSR